MNTSTQINSASLASSSVTFEQHFKVTKKSAIPDQIGKKRESVAVSLPGFAATDIPPLAESFAAEIAAILNEAISQRAKKLFLANSENWDFVPADSECSLEAIYSDLIAVSSRGSRTLTKESLKLAASYYSGAAIQFLGKSPKVAENGATLIEAKFAPILGNPAAVEVMKSNLLAICENENFDVDYLPQFEALITILLEATQSEIDENAL